MSRTTPKTSDWTVVEMLEWATGYFEEKQIPSPRLSIEWLLAHVLGVKRLELYMQFDRPLNEEELVRLKPLVKRRAMHEPLQYITGSTDFFNLTLQVTSDVLIPRPETEQLVEKILENHKAECSLDVLDLGTGSGCIALALKKARPHWNVTGIDKSLEAIQIARDNARINNLDVIFEHTGFETYECYSKCDIIVSNPPYVTPEEHAGLSRQVADFEPPMALIAENVSELYQQLMSFCQRCLKPAGRFYFEINEDTGDMLLKLMDDTPLRGKLDQDYDGKDRFLTGCFK